MTLSDLAAAMADINGQGDLEGTFASGVRHLRALLGAKAAAVSFESESGWVTSWGLSRDQPGRLEQVPEDGWERLGRGGAWSGDLAHGPAAGGVSNLPAGLAPGPCLVAPLRSGGQVGALAAFRETGEAPFEEDDLLLATLLAAPLASAIHAAGLAEQARATNQQMEALLATTEAMWRQTPFVEVASTVAEQATRLVPGTECMISIVPADRPDKFRIVAASGAWAQSLVGEEWPWQGTVAGAAMHRLDVIEVTDLISRSSLADTLAVGGIDTGRLIPLWTGSTGDSRRALGVLGFYRPGSQPFRPDQRKLMDEFGKRVSLTLHRAELMEAAGRATNRLRTGLDVTLDLAAALDHREVIRLLLQRAVEAVGANRASLSRLDGEELVVEDSHDRDGRPSNIGTRQRVRAGTHTEVAIQTGEPQRGTAFAPEDLSPDQAATHADTRHTAVIPLLIGDQVGAILLLTRRSDPEFSASDMETLQLIGNAAAIALRNAELYRMAFDLSRNKSDFMNLAAHELRTPLSVISGYISMLGDGSFGPIPPDWTRPLAVLTAKTAELGGLVEDLLVAARLEAGTMPIEQRDFDLRQAVEEAVERCEPRARLLAAEVICLLPPEPVMVRADHGHLGRILDNLLNNALTYTSGTPRLRLEVIAGGEPAVIVTDQGIGIPDDERERIFERFVRLDHPELARQPGTGLGLAISRELAERQGGQLVLLSGEGGASFALRLAPPPGA